MRLRETQRQIVAGGAAAAVYLVLNLSADFQWYIDAILAVAVYGGCLLFIERQKESVEISIDSGLTQADVEAAVRICKESAVALNELAQLLSRSDPELAGIFQEIARLTRLIAENYVKDPLDLKHSRGFVDHHLPGIIKAARSYVDLRGATADSIAASRELAGIRPWFLESVPRVQSIYEACLANDFDQLRMGTRALSAIMQSEQPGRTIGGPSTRSLSAKGRN